MYNVLMTFTTRVFSHAQTSALDLDRFVKVARSKCEGMKKSVFCFGEILWHKPGRRMAIVAGRDRPMTRLDPAIKMVLHDVAVSTGARVVTQVGCALGINKGVTADTCHYTQRESDQN